MVGGVKQLLLICAVVMGQSVLAADEKPLIVNPIIEKAIRKELKKPKGELTEADYEQLTTLSLFNTKITDAGLKEVAELKQLEWLFLGYTQITDAGLKEVAKLQHLKTLVLPGTEITDAGLKEVAKLQKLTELYLNGTKVTKSQIDELEKALPNCFISSNPTK